MNELASSHAAVIGIDAYSDGIAGLETAVADARAVAAVLERDHGYGPLSLLLDGEATGGRLRRLFEEDLRRRVGADDRLLVYFAGHGVALDERGEGPRGFLLPWDARADSQESWLSMTWLHEALDKLSCRHLLLVLDCCFAGTFRWTSPTRSFVPMGRLYDSQYERFLAGRAWQVLTSAAHNEKALDVTFSIPRTSLIHNRRDTEARAPSGHSPFAAALLRGLAGDADSSRGGFDPDGVITATELHQYVFEALAERDPRTAAEQTPGLWPLKLDNAGEFIFLSPGRTRATRPDPPLDERSNPWRGLAPYTEDSAGLFFGRERVIEAMENRLSDASSPPVLAVAGASGSGKSSLVLAGLLGRLEGSWTVVVADRLGSEPAAVLADVLKKLALAPEGRPALVVIDQFEELYTQCHDAALRDACLAALQELLDRAHGDLRVLVTLRSDFEPLVAASGLGDRLAAGRFVVPPLNREELRQVIERPAQVRALYFEPPELVDRLLDEVAAVAGPLPLLSFVLSEIYRLSVHRRRRTGSGDRALTEEDWNAAGGVVGVLHRRASALLESAGPARRKTVRRIFLRMISAESGQLARRRVSRRELDFADPAERSRVRTVLDGFTRARLLVADENHVEPAHDSLILAWPELNAWRSTHGATLALQRAAWWAALDWDAGGGDSRLLWDRDPRLPQLESMWRELNRLEQHFVRASRRRRRQRRRAAAGVSLAISGALAALAAHASRKARLARSRLRDALEAADEIVFSVDRELLPIAGTAPIRRQLLDSASELLDRLRAGAAEDAEAAHSRVASHIRRGDLARSHENLAQVVREYRAAVEVAERLVESEPRRLRWRFALSHSLSKLAGATRARGDLVRATDLYEQSLRILERLVRSDPENLSWQRSLAIRCNQLGALASAGEDLERAREWYERSLEIKLRLPKEEPDGPRRSYDLFVTYDQLGRVSEKRGDPVGARAWYEKSLVLKRNLAGRDPRNSRWQHALAISFERLGGLAAARGEREEARTLLEKSLSIREALLAADPENSYWKRGLAISYDRLGGIAESGGDLEEARAWYAKSADLHRALVEADPRNTELREDLKRSRSRLSGVVSSRSAQGRIDRALDDRIG